MIESEFDSFKQQTRCPARYFLLNFDEKLSCAFHTQVGLTELHLLEKIRPVFYIVMTLKINIVYIFLSATLVASHNLTDSEVMAFDPPEEIKVAFPYYLSGYTEDQVPIWIFEAGKWDMRKYAELGGEQYDAMDIHVHKMFLTFKESALNSSAQQYIAMADMEGLNIRQAGHPKTVQFMVQQFARLERIARDGWLKLGVFVNSNLLFDGVLKIGMPLLGSLQNVIEVYGSNKDAWIPKLLKLLPKDQLPEHYGGPVDHKIVKFFG
ncbi:unnamed protein product [Allacma fusca]|uniref:CRAL-TRIO domain-containing protein n=1 Tax=Allacma fusca TaxID=39272 RepID=A0A8J2JMP0_9HEXA|nr:unnamed protein product [Allacma fusca]